MTSLFLLVAPFVSVYLPWTPLGYWDRECGCMGTNKLLMNPLYYLYTTGSCFVSLACVINFLCVIKPSFWHHWIIERWARESGHKRTNNIFMNPVYLPLDSFCYFFVCVNCSLCVWTFLWTPLDYRSKGRGVEIGQQTNSHEPFISTTRSFCSTVNGF